MRAYKFRAWDNYHKEIINWEQYKDELVSNDFEDDDLMIMQYTGLKDQNGIEIYEGDIVQVGVFNNLKCKVYYSNKMQAFMLKDLNIEYEDSINFMSQFDDYKVIGNVFQNPELMNI